MGEYAQKIEGKRWLEVAMDWDGNGQLICVDLSGDWPLGKGRRRGRRGKGGE
jgi:hypothetical protein